VKVNRHPLENDRMTTYEKMTTRELDAWIREGGKT